MTARRAVLVAERSSTPPGVVLLLILTTLVVGFLVGAAYRSFDQSVPEAETLDPKVAAPVIPPAQTMVVVVNLPPEPTATVTLTPTPQNTAAPTVDIRINWCSNRTPAPGTECQQQPVPTGTAVPRPSCPTDPGMWCIWRSDPDTGPEQETG